MARSCRFAELCKTIEAASGKTGLQKKLVGMKTYPVALVANGLNPLRLLKSWWSGAQLDALRNGPLDKHGVGSRILDATAEVHESEIARLAEFGSDWPDPNGGTERGLTSSQIKTYMDANFERAKGHRRAIDRLLMKGEWPVLLDIMGKGEGDKRYLSVAEVRTLFVDRRLPDRINARLVAAQGAPAPGVFRKLAKAAVWLVALAIAAIVAIAEFPESGWQDHSAAGAIDATVAAGARAGKIRALARPELVDRGPPLVPPCEPGHRDIPGALRLVPGAGTAGPLFVHQPRPPG